MSADKNSDKPAAPLTPDQEANSRINVLRAQIGLLEKELHTIQGKLSNRDPSFARKLAKENSQLRGRVTQLERALIALLSDEFKARDAGDLRLKTDVLQQAAVEFFKKANIDPDLWKNIVS